MQTQFRISGFVVGKIWMPAAECFKDVGYTFQRTKDNVRPCSGWHDTLRDALLHITNDGDFQSCKLSGDSVLTVRRISEGKSGTRITRERSFPLNRFPSVSDMVRDDDWSPVELF